MIPNEVLLDKTLEYIKVHPEQHDQTMWRCSTGMCFAGTAATLAGVQWAEGADGIYGSYVVVEEDSSYPGETYDILIDDDKQALVTPVWQYAEHILGLEHDDAMRLFDARNMVSDIERVINDIKERAGLL